MDADHVTEFVETGVTVVENVFSDEEVQQMRTQFHAQLADYGVNHEQLLSGRAGASKLDGARIKGRAATIFYAKWKLDAMLDPRVVAASRELLLKTYGDAGQLEFTHPFGKFDQVVPFIDRVCYRLPDSVRAEGGLQMHIDRNPQNPYQLDPQTNKSRLQRWRPIQSFIALTDHWGSANGGLTVVRGMHRQLDGYFARNWSAAAAAAVKEAAAKDEGGGEFYRLHDRSHSALESRLEPVIAPRGSIVFFDNRLPHATCKELAGDDTREVVYFSYLPAVPLNMSYAAQQAENLKQNVAPPAFRKERKLNEEQEDTCDRHWSLDDDLTAFQKHVLQL